VPSFVATAAGTSNVSLNSTQMETEKMVHKKDIKKKKNREE
jgi:hypothetical protein